MFEAPNPDSSSHHAEPTPSKESQKNGRYTQSNDDLDLSAQAQLMTLGGA